MPMTYTQNDYRIIESCRTRYSPMFEFGSSAAKTQFAQHKPISLTPIQLVDTSGTGANSVYKHFGLLPMPFTSKVMTALIASLALHDSHLIPVTSDDLKAENGWSIWQLLNCAEVFDIAASEPAFVRDEEFILAFQGMQLDQKVIDELEPERRLAIASRSSHAELNDKLILHTSIIEKMDAAVAKPSLRGYKAYPFEEWNSNIMFHDPDLQV
ncbi:MAG: hypothetical protein PF961_03355 [Planctomycetota bacterium]|jgi:hypothetical protein|nr:hypothetical protein [Planctomycetota bacterium]